MINGVRETGCFVKSGSGVHFARKIPKKLFLTGIEPTKRITPPPRQKKLTPPPRYLIERKREVSRSFHLSSLWKAAACRRILPNKLLT